MRLLRSKVLKNSMNIGIIEELNAPTGISTGLVGQKRLGPTATIRPVEGMLVVGLGGER